MLKSHKSTPIIIILLHITYSFKNIRKIWRKPASKKSHFHPFNFFFFMICMLLFKNCLYFLIIYYFFIFLHSLINKNSNSKFFLYFDQYAYLHSSFVLLVCPWVKNYSIFNFEYIHNKT